MDVLLSGHFVEPRADPHAVFREFRRVLKSGGMAV
jgi:ubiquinone/menaquinone biosynthesis C-methylase UbiE